MRSSTLLLVALALAAPLSAQERSCRLVESGSGTRIGDEPNRLMFIGGGVHFRCDDGVSILSDSLAWFEASGIAEFVGDVRYTDEQNRLTAGYLRYLGREDRAIAQTDVVLTDLETGSTIEAPYMDYHRATEERPEPLIQMFSGRPHAVLVSVSEADSIRSDTTVVDADAMEITGRTKFAARGNVEMQQGELRGYGQFGDMDRDVGTLRLATNARLESTDYTLVGDTIVGEMTETDELSEVTATNDARLDTSEVGVTALSIRVFFVEGEVNRLVARGQPVDTTSVDPREQATAISVDFQLTADSLDVLAPGRQLDTVTAVGRAYGQRLGDDLGNATVPAIVAHDWMRGDRIITAFREAESMPGDTTDPGREIDTVTSFGSPATSAYRVVDEDDPEGNPAINYVRAERIKVSMVEGKVSTVDAAGAVQGIYLQPLRTALDTTAVRDTTVASRRSR